jgi:hypothetical protein
MFVFIHVQSWRFDLAWSGVISIMIPMSTYATLLIGGETKARAIASADATGRLAVLNVIALSVRMAISFLRRYLRRFTYDQFV